MILSVLDEYHQALIDLVEKEGYDKYNDFAVVIQPGLKDLKVPKNYVNFFGVHKSFLPICLIFHQIVSIPVKNSKHYVS